MDEILRFIADFDDDVYLVGGFVRDSILGRHRKDLDFVCLKPVELSEQVAKQFNGHMFMLKKEFGMARVVLPHITLDFSRMKEQDIQKDLSTRDFTLNAMAIKVGDYLESGVAYLIDPYGGSEDLDAHILRAVQPTSLRDDPVRVMRGLRFEAYLCFEPDEFTRELMTEASQYLGDSPPERIREEFYKILAMPASSHVVEEMFDLGALGAFFPELSGLATVEQNFHHRENAFAHSLGALQAMEEILRGSILPATYKEKIEKYSSVRISSGITIGQILKFAALAHDLGKKETSQTRPDGRISFYGHDKTGAEIFEQAARRLKLSKEELRRIGRLVELHMRPLQLLLSGKPTDRAIHRLFKAAGEDILGLLLLAYADGMATAREHPGGEMDNEFKKFLLDLFKKIVYEEAKFLPLPIIDGTVIMQELGIPEGNLIGEMLEQLVLAQVEGQVTTKEEAIDFLKSRKLICKT